METRTSCCSTDSERPHRRCLGPDAVEWRRSCRLPSHAAMEFIPSFFDSILKRSVTRSQSPSKNYRASRRRKQRDASTNRSKCAALKRRRTSYGKRLLIHPSDWRPLDRAVVDMLMQRRDGPLLLRDDDGDELWR